MPKRKTNTHEKRNQTRSRLFHGLAHPARLRIVERLTEGPCSVTELAELIGFSAPTTSAHLNCLKTAGIVVGVKEKNRINYEIRRSVRAAVRRLLDTADKISESDGDD